MSTALWEVYDYEVGMFSQMHRFLVTDECKKLPLPIRNAIVESMLLHLRILTDILLSRGLDDDDIHLKELLPGFHSPIIAQLKTAYGNRKTVGSPCWEINKRLAHPTKVRSGSYDYNPVLHAPGPLVSQLLDEITAARGTSGTLTVTDGTLPTV